MPETEPSHSVGWVERIAALAIVIATAATPTVGLLQTLMGAVLVAVAFLVWDRVEVAAPSDEHGFLRRALASVTVLSAGAAMLYAMPLQLLWWRGVERSPTIYLVGFGAAALLGLTFETFRGRTTPRDIGVGAVFALLAGSAWLYLSTRGGLADTVRLHPRLAETIALGSTIAFGGATLRKGRAARPRFYAFVVALPFALALYWSSAPRTEAALGFWRTSEIVTDPTERLRLAVELDGPNTNIFAIDVGSGERVRVFRINSGHHAGVTLEFAGEQIVLQWVEASGEAVGWCSQARPVFDYGAVRRETLTYCPESTDILQCMTPVRPSGLPCDKNAHCASGRCLGGACSDSILGEPCRADEFCSEGTCIGRVCRIEADGFCDSDPDCGEGYCVLDPGSVVGRCYEGEVGDPCTSKYGQCEQSSCVQRPGDETRSCRAGIHHVVF